VFAHKKFLLIKKKILFCYIKKFFLLFVVMFKMICFVICIITIIVAVTEGLVREEQLLHDMCLLGAVTVEITQILTRARHFDVSISEPLLR
jgi:hypothetical protein